MTSIRCIFDDSCAILLLILVRGFLNQTFILHANFPLNLDIIFTPVVYVNDRIKIAQEDHHFGKSFCFTLKIFITISSSLHPKDTIVFSCLLQKKSS